MKSDANGLFKDENYKEALQRYKILQESEPENADFNYKLGVCYVKTDVDKKKAAEFLKNATGKKDVPKEAEYFLGEALRFNNEFSDAISEYEKYKENMKGKPNAAFKTDLRIEWCKNAVTIMSQPKDVRFENPGKNVNSPYPDFRPVIGADDGILYYSSNRKGNMGGIIDGFGEYLTDIYYSLYNDTSWSRAKNAGTNLNSEGYNEVLYLTMNGDKMLMYNEGGDAKGDIYYSELKGKQWIKPMMMGDAFATKELETGAAMMQDMKTIFFAAELKGGKGGKDIWMMLKDSATGKWGSPVNMGENINTAYDEINPFLFFDGKTLFFASEGHNSMGGFDIFKSTLPDPRQGWTKAENIGYPINTVFDDKYFALDGTGKTAYVAALREGGFGDQDIYKVELKESLVMPQPIQVNIIAVNASGLPVRDAVCIVTVKSNGELIGTFNSNVLAGNISMSVPAGEYRIKIRSPKAGKVDDDITISGDESNFRKVLKYNLK